MSTAQIRLLTPFFLASFFLDLKQMDTASCFLASFMLTATFYGARPEMARN
jgi:hypothetical protein